MNASPEFSIFVTRDLPGDFASVLRTRLGDRTVAVDVNADDAPIERDALLDSVRGRDGLVSTPRDRIDAAVLDAAGPRLRMVSNYATGVDNVDLDACRSRGVLVGHTPDPVTEPTADVAWLLILAAARRAEEGGRLVRSGAWRGVAPGELLGRRLDGATLLLVGAGRIALAVARRALGWRMSLLYVARSRHPEFEAAPYNARRVELDEGLEAADVVSLHTPLTDETRHLIDARRLRRMKRTAVLVNTARGPVVDEAALVEALRGGDIMAAGLDVFEREPRLQPELASLPNAVLLPHLGSATVEDRTWMTEIAAANLAAALCGAPVPHEATGAAGPG